MALSLDRWVNAGGVRTHYLTAGHGEPILLLHGAGMGVSAEHNWRGSTAVLTEKGFSVYAPDIVGFGESDKPAGGNTIESKVQHVKNFIDVLCLERFHLLGNSLGGRITLGIAHDWPHRVKRAILSGAAGLAISFSPVLRSLAEYHPSKEKMREYLTNLCYDSALVTDEMVDKRYRLSLLPGAREAYSKFISSANSAEGMTKGVEEMLPRIQTPTLLIWGKQDRVVPPEIGQKMAALLPNSRLEIIDECGHWAQIEHPDHFHQLVGDFLSR
ncbi:MAG: alpha/beta fold hydrolase [Candidatus Binataceae bacterium]